MKPHVVVGVSYAHPRPDHLANCLESLRAQSYGARLVLCQDCTVPGPLEEPEGVELHGVTYDRQQGGNLPKVRNALLQYEADIYIWLDGDCIVDQTFVRGIVNRLAVPGRMMVFPRVRVALPRALRWDPLGRLMDLEVRPPASRGIDKSRDFIEAARERIDWDPQARMEIVCGPCQACRSEDALLWDEDFTNWGCDDQDWGYRMLSQGLEPWIGPTVYHQEHEVTADWMTQEGHQRNIAMLRRKHGLG